MNLPMEVKKYGDQIVVTFPAQMIGFGFEHFTERFGSVRAELTVIYQPAAGATEIMIGPARIDLLNSREANYLSKDLEAGRFRSFEWQELVTRACRAALMAQREIGNVVSAKDIPDPGTTSWLFDGLVPLGNTAILAAAGGSLKSYIAIGMCVSAASGVPLAPGVLEPLRKVETLYLDWETCPEDYIMRVHQICRGMGLLDVPEGLHYLQMSRPISECGPYIRKIIDKRNIEMVVIDSIGAAAGGKIEESDAAIRIMNTIREFGSCARLALTHITKAGADEKASRRTPFGSGYFQNLARTVWILENKGHPGEDEHLLALNNTKVNLGRQCLPLAIRAQFSPYDELNQQLTFSRADITQDVELAAGAGTIVQGIIAVLRQNGSATNKELEEILEAKASTVRGTTNRLQDKGVIVRLPSGEWGLVDGRNHG